MSYNGNIELGDTIDIKFTTINSSGVPTALASGTVAAYPDNSTTEITAGITLSADFDTRTGLNNVRVVATGGNGYAAGNYSLVLTAGTVGGSSVVGYVVGSFSVGARVSDLSAATETQIDDIETDVTAILADTNELQTDWVNGGRLDTILDARASQSSLDTVQTDISNILTIVSLFSTFYIEGTINDASPTSADFDLSSGFSATDDIYNGAFLMLTTGTYAGLARKISDYVGASKNVQFNGGAGDADEAFPGAPANGESIIIFGVHGA